MKTVARVLVVLAVVAVFVGAGLGVGAVVHHGQDNARLHEHEKLARFYALVAGTERATTPTADVTLAADLQVRLGPIDPAAVRLPDRITRFRGSSIAYGGVTEIVGTNPFAGGHCECGALTDRMQRDLLRIKRGQIDQLTAELTRPVSSTKPTFALVVLGGLIVGGGSLFLIQRSTYRRKR